MNPLPSRLSPNVPFTMPYKKDKNDQTEVIELMRMYCDPRGIYGWSPRKASKHISGKGDEARPAAPSEGTFADRKRAGLSSSTIRRWYVLRPMSCQCSLHVA